MKLQIDFHPSESNWKIAPTDKLLSLGSCFSDEIGNRLKMDGFNILCNPFGVIFHPLAIANLLTKCLDEDFVTQAITRDDVYFSLDASGTLFGYSEDALKTSFRNQMKQMCIRLQQADVLLITFGTAIGFRHIETHQLVSNCHKLPASNFEKEMTSIEEMVRVWKEMIRKIKKINPKVQIIFTVSPTKHLRNGVVENVHSKSRLIEVVHQLGENYFPSFEWVQEVFRDYRFFKEDGTHPNNQAIEEVYQQFQKTYFSEASFLFQTDISKYNQLKEHRILYEKSHQAKQLHNKLEETAISLKQKYSFLSEDFFSRK